MKQTVCCSPNKDSPMHTTEPSDAVGEAAEARSDGLDDNSRWVRKVNLRAAPEDLAAASVLRL